MTKQEFDSLKVGSKIKSNLDTWEGTVIKWVRKDGHRKVVVIWECLTMSFPFVTETFGYKDLRDWTYVLSSSVTAIGLEELA